MEVSNEISLKIKTAIKAKLLELGIFIGEDELPDYIMVMIANKRSQDQMNEDLALFLGESTETFTSWLHGLLARLQSVASEPITVMVKPLQSTDTPSSKSPLSSASVSDSESSGSPKKAPKLKSGSANTGSRMTVQKKNIAPRRKLTNPASDHGSIKKLKSSVLDSSSSDITGSALLETDENDTVLKKAVTELEPEPAVQTIPAESDLELSGVQEALQDSESKPEENAMQEECDIETESDQALKAELRESASPVAISGPDTDREFNLSSETPNQSYEDNASPAIPCVMETLSRDETVNVIQDSTPLPSKIVDGENNGTLSADIPDASPSAASSKEKRKYSGDDVHASPSAEPDSHLALHEMKKVKPSSETCADSTHAAVSSGESKVLEKRERSEKTVVPTVSSESGKQALSKSAELGAGREDGAVDSIQYGTVREALCPTESEMTLVTPDTESSECSKVDGDVPLPDESKAGDIEIKLQPAEVSSESDQEVKDSSEVIMAENSAKTPSTFAGSVNRGNVSDVEEHKADTASNQRKRGNTESSEKNITTEKDSKADHSGNSKSAAGGSEKQKTGSESQKSARAASGTVTSVDAGSQLGIKTPQLCARSKEQGYVKDEDKQRSVSDKALVHSSSTKMTASSREEHEQSSSKGSSVSDTRDAVYDVRDSQQHGDTASASGELPSEKVRMKQSSAGDYGKINMDAAEAPRTDQSKSEETNSEKPKSRPGNHKTASTTSASVQPEKPKSSLTGSKSKQSDIRLTPAADCQQPGKDSKKQKSCDVAGASALTPPHNVKVKPSALSEKSKQPGSKLAAASEKQQDTGKHDTASGESFTRKVIVHAKPAVGENKHQDNKQVVHAGQQASSKVEKQRSHHAASAADQSLTRKVSVKTPPTAGGNSKVLDSNPSKSGMPADHQSGVKDSKKQKTAASSASATDPVRVRKEKPVGDRSKQSDTTKSAKSSTSSDSDSQGHVRGSEKQKTAIKLKASPVSGQEKAKTKALPAVEKVKRLTDGGSLRSASDGDTASASSSVSRKESKPANRNSSSHGRGDLKSKDGAAKKSTSAVVHNSDKESKARSESVSISDSDSRKRRSESVSSSDSGVPPHKHVKQDFAKSEGVGAPKVSMEESSNVRTVSDKPAKVVKSLKTEKPSSLSDRDCKQKISLIEVDSKGQCVSDKDLKQKSSVRKKVVSAERQEPVSSHSEQKSSGGRKAVSEEQLASDKGCKQKKLVLEKDDPKGKPSSKSKGPRSEKVDLKRQSFSDKDSKRKIHISDKDEDRREKSAHVTDSEKASAQASEKDSDDIARELESQGHIRRIVKLKRVA